MSTYKILVALADDELRGRICNRLEKLSREKHPLDITSAPKYHYYDCCGDFDLAIVSFTQVELESERKRITISLPNYSVLFGVVEKDDEATFINCFMLCSDCLGVPFSLEEFSARVLTCLQKPKMPRIMSEYEQQYIFVRGLLAIPMYKTLFHRSVPVPITGTQFSILELLIRHSDIWLTQEQIYAHVWNSDHVENVDKNVTFHINKLQRILKEHTNTHDFIVNRRDNGYKFAAMLHLA